LREQNQSSSAETPSFEQALTALEQIVRDLEEGRLGLAESLARYEEGVKLLKQCHGLLEHAERHIELLTGVDAVGNPVTEPFDDRATLAEEPKEPPRSRRSGKSSKKSQEVGPATETNSESASSAIDEPGSLF
jgi:exodeoxyribonuclease VII small subunit